MGSNRNENPYEASAGQHSDLLTHRRGAVFVVVAVVCVLISNVGAIGVMLTLLRIDPGSAIRPMSEAGASLLFSLIGLLIGFPCSVLVVLKTSRKTLGCILALANLSSFPVATVVLHLAADVGGFTLLE